MRGGNDASAADLADRGERRAERGAWADLRLRTVSALVLAPLALLALWIGGPAFFVIVAAAALGLAYEWAALCRAGGFAGKAQASGLVTIAVWAVALAWLRGDPLAGRANVIGLVLVIWGSDIGAYMVGRLIGGPKLAPRISPGKTWAGAAGGALASAMIAAGLARLLSQATHLAPALLLGVGLSVIGQAGDLAESALKRRCGVKDSGRLIPGHGGLLDRLDATLAAVPAAAVISLALGRGVILWQ